MPRCRSRSALVADNAKKVGGQTAAQILSQASQAPGPASSASTLVSVKSAPFSLGPSGQGDFAAICDAGQKAIGGGYDNPVGTAFSVDNRPTSDGASWKVYLIATSSGAASGNIYAVCLK